MHWENREYHHGSGVFGSFLHTVLVKKVLVLLSVTNRESYRQDRGGFPPWSAPEAGQWVQAVQNCFLFWNPHMNWSGLNSLSIVSTTSPLTITTPGYRYQAIIKMIVIDHDRHPPHATLPWLNSPANHQMRRACYLVLVCGCDWLQINNIGRIPNRLRITTSN